MATQKFVKCSGCSSIVLDIKGPVHRYIGAVAGCWNIYRKVLSNPSLNQLSDVHRQIVDTYAVQHPGNESELTIQSVAIHLMGLYLFIERKYDSYQSTELIRNAIKRKNQFIWLNPPNKIGDLTIADIYKTKSTDDFKKAVDQWSRSVWESWSEHHNTIAEWSYKQ